MKECDYRICRLFRALGNPLRYRILIRLAASPATPGDLSREFHRPLTTISGHLAKLRILDLVRFTPCAPSYLYTHKYDSLRHLIHAGERYLAEIVEAVAEIERQPAPRKDPA